MAPNALFIFMVPGSFEELRNRLSQRMTESTPQMELRLRTAAQELRQAELFDRQVVNSEDHLKEAVADIDATISAEKKRDGRTSILLL
jgi:guanylate kinase